ncbi:porin [Variovorax sp. J2P1-59]|uniref:porin n=1 Tax=Variovorax flavidus TaxID=3053501 RepID=UPI002575C67E|nr:porin [Variovorax sp. J2P1-59]MDM0075889.1 porin [Variovorax sp. J2P1-59]
MKKSLVALAALAVAGVASAQSSVTLFGVVDAAVSGYSNKTEDVFGNSVTTKRTALSNSGYNSSRLGFRGTEDLGGGLAASFWLEAGINNDDGTGQTITGLGPTATGGGGLTFNRRATVSLSGAFGEVRLGRDYTPTFWNDTVFDPFGTNGVGTNLISTANGYASGNIANSGFTINNQYVRSSNSIGYFLPPNLGGFYGQFMYAFNEKASLDPGVLVQTGVNPVTGAAVPGPGVAFNDSRTGRYIGGRVGYANGPLDVALSYAETTLASNFVNGTTSKLDSGSIGASYDFGVVKLFGEYSKADTKIQSSAPFPTTVAGALGFREPGADGWLVGVTVPVGPGLIRAAYSAVDYKNTTPANQFFGLPEPKASKWALGYVHNLSKRTALYATVAYIDNKNGADLTIGGSPEYFGNAPAVINVNPVTGVGTPNPLAVPSLTPKSSMGYDFGIRHAF